VLEKIKEKRKKMAYNYKLVIGYDGARYQGWQKNKNAKETIQTKLETALSRLLDEPIKLVGSGRTDKGVHAEGQVANFVTQQRQKANTLKYQLNQVLPDDIVIYSIQKMDIDFHSQFAAKTKTYRYTLWKANAEEMPLFQRKYVTLLKEKVQVDVMRLGAEKFLGTHDFKGFSNDKTKKKTERTIHSIDLIEEENYIEVFVTGNGFLYNMVRIMVGTLVEIGQLERHDESIDQIFEHNQRGEAGVTLPAQGLCLVSVAY